MSFDVKNTTLSSFLDIFLPYNCRGCGKIGKPLCERCKKYIIGGSMPIKSEKLETVYAAGLREGVLKSLVVEYKYQSRRGFAMTLAEILEGALPREIRERLGREEAIVVPLPTINRHVRERGFDHTARMAKALAKWLGLEYVPLLKCINSTVQVGADSEQRKKQAAEAYEVDEEVFAMRLSSLPLSDTVVPRSVLLVDDIWTTGASMEAAAEKIRQAGFKSVSGVVVAVGLKTDLLVAAHTSDGRDDEVDDGVSQHADD